MNFLVIRFSSLGDIVQTTAFVRRLKSLYPSSSIIYATKKEFGNILRFQSYIDRVEMLEKGESIFEFAGRIGRVHCVFDLHCNLRSLLLTMILNPACVKRVKKNTLYRYAILFKLKPLLNLVKRDSRDNIEEHMKLLGADYAREDVKPYLDVNINSVLDDSKVIGFAPGAKWKTKMWPKEYYKELARMLSDKGYKIHIFGSRSESSIAEYIASGLDEVESYCGKLPLDETVKFISRCKAFVCNDSGLMHVATALNVPTVAIFGPTVKEFGFFPRGNSIVLEKNLDCRPCSLHGSDKCPLRTFECMRSIKPKDVYVALNEWLD